MNKFTADLVAVSAVSFTRLEIQQTTTILFCHSVEEAVQFTLKEAVVECGSITSVGSRFQAALENMLSHFYADPPREGVNPLAQVDTPLMWL